MADRLLALIVDEGKWLPFAMGLALLWVSVLLCRHRRSERATRQRVAAAMNLFFGVTIGTMAFGHLLAVTTKLGLGTLRPGSRLVLYAIGILLAVPSWWLIHHSHELFSSATDRGKRTLRLNAWLTATLLAMGLHNLPIAAPGFFNIGYALHSRPIVGWALVSLAVAANVGLFVAALVFLASGQTFEEFRR